MFIESLCFVVLQRQHESRLYEITGRLEEIKYTLSVSGATLCSGKYMQSRITKD